MAFVPKAWSVNVTVKDNDKNISTVTAYQGGGLPFGDVETFAAAFAADVAALSDGVVMGYTINRVIVQDAPADPGEVSDVERKGVFTFVLANTRKTRVSIPSYKNSLVIDGSNLLTQADAAVSAFLIRMEASGTDSIGTDIIRRDTGFKRHVKNLRG